jgi:hypothetical protein
MSRATIAYVSAYQRSRIHQSRLYRYEQRTLAANFAGALSDDVTVKCVDWFCMDPGIAVMSDAVCTDTTGSVTVIASEAGRARLKCQAELTDGSYLTQLFVLDSLPAPYFPGETNPAAGAAHLHACAPHFSGELGLSTNGSGYGDLSVDFFSDHAGGTPYATAGLTVSSVAWTSKWYSDGDTSGTPTSTKSGTESNPEVTYDTDATYVSFQVTYSDQSVGGPIQGAVVMTADVETSAGNLSLTETFTADG